MKSLIFIFLIFLLQTDEPLVMFFPGSQYDTIYELERNYNKKNYKGIFFDGKYCILKDTKLLLTEGYEVCGELDPNQKVINSISDDSCLLILNLPYIKNHVFESVIINRDKQINPGYMQKISLNGFEYTISATGIKGEFKDDPFLNVRNYRLTVSSSVNGKFQKQIIVSVAKYNERYPARVFLAGDIDGDDKLDIVVEGGDHYAGSLYFLYLSSKAKPTELMGKVSEYQFSSC